MAVTVVARLPGARGCSRFIRAANPTSITEFVVSFPAQPVAGWQVEQDLPQFVSPQLHRERPRRVGIRKQIPPTPDPRFSGHTKTPHEIDRVEPHASLRRDIRPTPVSDNQQCPAVASRRVRGLRPRDIRLTRVDSSRPRSMNLAGEAKDRDTICNSR